MSLSDQLRLVCQRGSFGLVIFCTIAFAGCGGGGDEPAAGASESPSESSAPAVAIDAARDSDRKGNKKGNDDDDVDPIPAAAATTPNGNPAGVKIRSNGDKDDEQLDLIPAAAGLTTEAAPALTVRPENVDAWTNDDFLAAAREHDPKLLDAIDFKVKSSPGDAAVAALLTKLLDPSSPAVFEPDRLWGKIRALLPGFLDPSSPAAEKNQSETPAAPSRPGTPADSATGTGSAPPVKADPQAFRRAAGHELIADAGSIGHVADAASVCDHASSSAACLSNISCNLTHTVNTPQVLFAVDSATAMILESAVTWMPQGAAVGSIASGVPERIADDPGTPPRRRSKKDEEDDGMIQPGAPVAAAAAEPIVGSLQDQELVEHVIDGLIANNSQDAWHSVYGIVAGTVRTPIPAALTCEIVVERLFQNMDSNPAWHTWPAPYPPLHFRGGAARNTDDSLDGHLDDISSRRPGQRVHDPRQTEGLPQRFSRSVEGALAQRRHRPLDRLSAPVGL